MLMRTTAPDRGPNFGPDRLKIAVVGTGISGMAAAWLLAQRHDITVYERADRIGGHSNTVDAVTPERTIPVDTGFIVYNERTYPNLTALFSHLGVATEASEMTLGISLDGGKLEYGGSDIWTIFAQWRNLLRPRFWSMLRDIFRFYRNAPGHITRLDSDEMTLGDYLRAEKYGDAFRDDHLLPMAAAIWSAPAHEILDYPAASFIRFNDNHGLLKITNRPIWRTVTGGSREYVSRLTQAYKDRVRLNADITAINRDDTGVTITQGDGSAERYDHVVIAAPANHALTMLDDASKAEQDVLGAFRYSHNLVVLHNDATLMPKQRAVWSSWNFIGSGEPGKSQITVSYWMNRLQNIRSEKPLIVTLNPPRPPHAGTIFHSEVCNHPIIDTPAIAAQRKLWSLQGQNRTWFCGAYFGAGFHEDGLQSGLAVAEQLGGVRRPWTVKDESGRIYLDAPKPPAAAEPVA
jgi:hypothetical protein